MESFFETKEAHDIADGVRIHPTALVAKGANLGKRVTIGPFAVVGPHVTLGDDVEIGAHAVISGNTKLGDKTRVFASATLGSAPQDLKYAGEKTELVIGVGNMIREYVNISMGTKGGGGVTKIGDNNLIMAYTHIAHDCDIGSQCILANGVQLAGHVTLQDNVVFGGMSGAHQFCSFGEYVMVGAGAIVVQDVPPYLMVQGDRAGVTGLNVVGLRRADITGEKMNGIKHMFRIVYKENLTLQDAIVKIRSDVADSDHKAKFLDFLEKSERGICR